MKVYAFKANLDNILESSSGGAFYALAEIFFNRISGDKIVFGAAYDANCNVVQRSAHSLEECKPFRGSKYAVCDYTTSFKETEEYLQAGYSVLYSGIPCQIFALKKHMELHKVNCDKLFTVDIICHGMPQKKVWDDYRKILEKTYGSGLIGFNFRDKKTHSKDTVMTATFASRKKVRDSHLVRSYMELYFTYLPLRNSCYQCKFSNMNRISDITIGDFWGIEDLMPNVSARNGISEIIVNTETGQSLVDFLVKSHDYDLLLPYEKDDFIKYQHNLNAPTPKPQNTETFWKDYNETGYAGVIKKYTAFTFKGRVVFEIKKTLRYMGVYTKLQKRFKK